MGDIVLLQINIPLAEGEMLDTSAIPLQGAVTPWLDLYKLDWQIDKNTLVIKTQWQLFSTVEYPQPIYTPTLTFKLIHSSKVKSRLVKVPSQWVVVSPVLSPPLTQYQFYSDVTPLLFDDRTPRYAMWAAFSGAVFFALCAMWWWDMLPFISRYRRPLALLHRHISGQISSNDAILNFSQMKSVHKTLNQIAQQTLYPDTLSHLFEAAPYLLEFEEDIRLYFVQSWQVIYGNARELMTAKMLFLWLQPAIQLERLHHVKRK